MRTIPLILALVGAVLVVPAALSLAQTTVPASQPATSTSAPAQLAAMIETIRSADNPSAAVSAYAQASAIDFRNADLNTAYMRKMLRFGLPQVAGRAAQILTNNGSNDPTAWSLMAYVSGKQGDWPLALTAAMRAILADKSDPSLMNNTGQLVAWFDREQTPPKVNDSVRRAIDQYRKDWMQNASFAAAYQRMTVFYDERDAQRKNVEQQITDAQTAVRDAQKSLTKKQDQIRDTEKGIADHQKTVDSLSRQYIQARDTGITPGNSTPSSLMEQIRVERQAIDTLKKSLEGFRREAGDMATDIRNKQADAEKLRQQLTPGRAKLGQIFRWDPPAVDGVVTPELEKFPVAASRPATTSDPATPADEAQRRIRMAKLYLSNNMKKEAAGILTEILQRYPATPAAEEAKQLLANMPKE